MQNDDSTLAPQLTGPTYEDMDGGLDNLTLSVIGGMGDVLPEDWDACAGPNNPFVCHAFLSAMEDSGSVSAQTGWLPRHILVRDPEGRLLACAPAYLKSHSYGEYVFDWGWAEAYERAGGRYYPKLQVAVPFTPATGPRLMVAPGRDRKALQSVLLNALVQVAQQHKASSVHITFPTESEYDLAGESGLLQRIGQQYHWENPGYDSFDDFLAALSSRKRKNIRKERDSANALGVTFRFASGDDLTPALWKRFYEFYRSTTDKKWGSAYLTPEFFHLLGERMGDRVVLVVGEEDGEPVCGALNLKGSDTLFGRNWGATRAYKNLHFEACYYRAIDYAIAHGLKRVEAGAQGAHKISRGYLPVPTYSAHWFADRGLADAVANYLDHERQAIAEDIDDLAEAGPYRKTC